MKVLIRDDDRIEEGSAQAGDHSSQNENGMQVLVAEDDPVTRRLLKVSLERWNYEVIAVDNGTLARHALLREELQNWPSSIGLCQE